MFDGLCILLALFLFYKAEKGYRNIAFFLLCWFIVSDVVYHYFFTDFRADNNWFIYQLYSTVNLFILYKLKPLVPTIFILVVISANVFFNIIISLWFISTTDDKMIYNMYPYPAGIVMLLVLSYMWAMGYGIRRVEFYRNNRSLIYSFLRLALGRRIWYGDRLQAKGIHR